MVKGEILLKGHESYDHVTVFLHLPFIRVPICCVLTVPSK